MSTILQGNCFAGDCSHMARNLLRLLFEVKLL